MNPQDSSHKEYRNHQPKQEVSSYPAGEDTVHARKEDAREEKTKAKADTAITIAPILSESHRNTLAIAEEYSSLYDRLVAMEDRIDLAIRKIDRRIEKNSRP